MEQKDIQNILNLQKQGKSLREISKELNINRSTVAYVCSSKSIDKITTAIRQREEDKENFEKLVCEAARKCYTYSQICDAIGKNRTRQYVDKIKQIIEKYNIDISHFKTFYNVTVPHGRKMPLEEMFRDGSNVSTDRLKNRLLKEGLKEYKCEKCGIVQWNGEPISLQLHHINGSHTDNRIENLQILCPNCHSQTDNFCKKKNSKPEKETKVIKKDIDPEKILFDYKNCGSLEKVATINNVSPKTIKKYFIKNGLLPKGKKIKDLVIEKYGKQPQWDEYRNFEAMVSSSKSKSFPILQYDLNGNFIRRYNGIQETKEYGFFPKSVNKCINGQLKTHKKFVWKKEI